MIRQQRDALVHTQQMQLLQLKQREMTLMVNNFNQILVMATLLIYPSYETCINFHMPGADQGEDVGTRSEVNMIHVSGMAACLVLSVYCVCVTTAATVWGPELVIFGAQGKDIVTVATVMNRGIAAMRVARWHIYGSYALSLSLLCIFFVIGTTHRIGFWRRMGVSGAWHTAAAAIVGTLMLLGYAASLMGVINVHRVFSKWRLLKGRLERPSVKCIVCGSRARHGLFAEERSFLFRTCRGQKNFKCYQCAGMRSDFVHQGFGDDEPRAVAGAAGPSADYDWDVVEGGGAPQGPGGHGHQQTQLPFHPAFQTALPRAVGS